MLIGYDTESGTVVEASHEPLKILEKSINALINLHVKEEVPATFFIVGRTLELGHLILRKLTEYRDLFDIQQHTYSHLPLKSIRPKTDAAAVTNDFGVNGGKVSEIAKEVRKTNVLISKYLDSDCFGIRGPWGYYLGLSDKPGVLGVMRDNGICFTSTYLRNKDDFFPVPMSVQPFTYRRQGFPEIMEIPSQDWIDCVWRTFYGWGRTNAFSDHLSNVLTKLSKSNSRVWGTCFHDWSVVMLDPNVRIMKNFFQQAKKKKIEILSYGGYYKSNR